jgi:hypothetical protein
MAIKNRRWCPGCQKTTEQVYYGDYRPGSPNAYYQCSRCHSSWYRCSVHGVYKASRPTDAQDGCECFEELDEGDVQAFITVAQE